MGAALVAAPAQESTLRPWGGGIWRRRRCQRNTSEADPTTTWEAFQAFGRAVDEAGVARLTFAAPFFGTNVGTDDYTDQL